MITNNVQQVVIICGPTASGKTNLAHELADTNNGEVINADSMQLYKQIPIITASPTQILKNRLTYHLYNFQDISAEMSAVKYVNMATDIIQQISSIGKMSILVGGSGMYISMLTNGYSMIPDIDKDIRKYTRHLQQSLGNKLFFQQLQTLDPDISRHLNMDDTQRTARAYEVVIQTGKSILYFQQQKKHKPLSHFRYKIISLLPERNFLYRICNQRLTRLFDSGGVDEVAQVYNTYGDIQTTAMKAIGVQEIIQYITGKISLRQALDLASARTRQYAKRQTTWFQHQIQEDAIMKFSSVEQYKQIMYNIIHSFSSNK